MKTRYFIDQYSDIIETDEDTYNNLYNRYEAGEGVQYYTETNPSHEIETNQLFKTIEDYNGYTF